LISRQELLILGIILLVVGAVVYYGPFGLPEAIDYLFLIIMVIGIIAIVIWIVLAVIDAIKRNP
jgi:uncharacterized membrane protein HdeD (DUF308 family)